MKTLSLTTNETAVLVKMTSGTTLKNQPWITTKEVADITGSSTLVAAGLVCSMLRKDLLVSKKMSDGSSYQYTDLGMKSVVQHAAHTSIPLTYKEEAILKIMAETKSPRFNSKYTLESIREKASQVSKNLRAVLLSLERKGVLLMDNGNLQFTKEGYRVIKEVIA